jgi:hypothetical protein
LQIGTNAKFKTIADHLDPAIILTVGKRDLVSQNGWNIFFDKTAYLKYKSYPVVLDKTGVKVVTSGSQTEIIVSGATAGSFSGSIQPYPLQWQSADECGCCHEHYCRFAGCYLRRGLSQQTNALGKAFLVGY